MIEAVTLIIGTSGWQYRSWGGSFYPPGLPQRRWLSHYAQRFASVEVNNTFYRLPERATFERWHDEVPGDFSFALKASRYLTHIRRLKDPAEPVQRLLERAAGLGDGMGPILIQLPPGFTADPERLRRTLDAFPAAVRVVVEPRDDSWFAGAVREILERRGAALCLTDRRNRLQTPLWRTAAWGFLRLHEGTASPRPCYGDGALNSWLDRIQQLHPAGDDVHVFFNNDACACAPRDARRLAVLARRRHLEVTRAGDPSDG